MKFKYLFFAVISAVVAFGACSKEDSMSSLKDISLSKTFVAIPPAGGSETVEITSSTDWKINNAPEWIGLSTDSGAAGKTSLSITLEACEYGRQAELKIAVGNLTQFLTVRQGEMTAETVTCKESMEGVEGKTYRVRGTVASIVQDVYGNMYLEDGSGKQCYVYGTLDKDGAEKNFKSLGIEVGDVVTVEGPLKYYNPETPELVNVTVLKIEKSLLKLVKDTFGVPKEGGQFEVKAAYKGNGAVVDFPESNVISLVGNKFIPGIPSKLEKNPADTLLFTFAVPANEGGVRTLSFAISSSRKAVDGDGKVIIGEDGNAKVEKTSMNVTVTQEGSTTPINEVVVGEPCFVAGTITAFCAAGFIITDETGSILYYQSGFANPNNYELGDKVEVTCSKATTYNGALEVEPANITKEVKVGHEDVTYPAPELMGTAAVEEYLASCDGVTAPCKYVKVCGKLSISGKYYNIILGDSEKQGSLYQATDAQKALFENDKSYEITGYLIGYSKSGGVVKFANFLVIGAQELNPTKTFAEIIAAGAGNYSCEATVVAMGSNQVALTDGTDYMFMYNKAKNAAVGTKILLNGAVTQYNGCWEWNDPAFYVSEKEVEVKHPEPVVLTATEYASYQSAPKVQYYKVVGTKGESGYDVTGDGFVVNPYSNATINPGSVTLYGYSIGIKSNKMNFIVASVEQ